MEPSTPSLTPLAYHDDLVRYLKSEETAAWDWFASSKFASAHADALRLDLLKQTYRLELGSYPDLALAVDEARERLGLSAPVTLYQSQGARELNACLVYLPGEAHIVFQGPVLNLLDPRELRTLLGHELAHYLLWTQNHDHLVADRLVHANAADPRAQPAHRQTARLLRLYTEVFADRGALTVAGDPLPAISCLVKMQTGLTQVDPASYVRQAEEIFARSRPSTDELSHPEAFIRARALMLRAENHPRLDVEIARMIEGEVGLDSLDLLGQTRLAAMTRRWIEQLLQPAWFRTETVRAHARHYFPGFEFPAATPPSAVDRDLAAALEQADASVRDYLCYVLLDFAAVDAELADEPLRAAFALAGHAGMADRLETIAAKELKRKKAELQQLRPAPPASAAPSEA